MHCLANPAYRQAVFCDDRIGRFMSHRAHKIIDGVDTETTGNAVAVVDEVAVGCERLVRRGDFQSPVLRGATDIRRPAEDLDAPVVILWKTLWQYPRILDHP